MDASSYLVPCTLVFICIPPGQVFYLKGLGQSERPLPCWGGLVPASSLDTGSYPMGMEDVSLSCFVLALPISLVSYCATFTHIT